MNNQERYWILDSDFVRCFCGEAVPQYDATGGGSGDPEFDYPATVECENCGQHWRDGDPVDDPCPWRKKA